VRDAVSHFLVISAATESQLSQKCVLLPGATPHNFGRDVTTPMLVLEGADISWGRRPARENARAYHTEAEFLPRMGHNMMLEPGWQAVAERIDGWLAAQGL